jgi:PAS domain S-box-containing protein
MMVVPAQSVPESNPLPAGIGNEDRLRLLIETGLLLASERSLDVIVQAALDAGRKLSGAEFGLFVYVHLGDDGEPCQLCSVTGIASAHAAAIVPLIHLEQLFNEFCSPDCSSPHDSVQRRRSLRIADVEHLPEHQRPCIFSGMARVRSYMAVPVHRRNGELLGALLYGHSEPDVFTGEGEDLVATIASQAAIAIDNFRLGSTLVHEIAIADSARASQRETAERLRQALDAAQLGTFTWDRASDLLDLDERAAQLFGVRPGQRITRADLRERIVIPEDRPTIKENLQHSMESRTHYYAEYRIGTETDGQRWLAASGINTYATGSTEIVGMVGTVQDISARRTQEETLRQSEKLAATGRLAATIAHEINNPLEAITNLIYLSRTDPDVPVPVRNLLETADAELARVSQIAQQTLGFYRDTTRPVTIDINALLTSIVDLFQRKMRSKSLSCTLDLQPDTLIIGLQGEIRQVFSNLLVNAIDASQQANLHIRTRRRHCSGKECVAVVISDQGSGIPTSVRERLFTPFVTSKESVGTGLGLWVTRGIVEKQGGSIAFRTRNQSPTGTCFRVILPIEPTASRAG